MRCCPPILLGLVSHIPRWLYRKPAESSQIYMINIRVLICAAEGTHLLTLHEAGALFAAWCSYSAPWPLTRYCHRAQTKDPLSFSETEKRNSLDVRYPAASMLTRLCSNAPSASCHYCLARPLHLASVACWAAPFDIETKYKIKRAVMLRRNGGALRWFHARPTVATSG